MKNKRFFAGILGFALVFGLILCGCPTDGDDGGGNMPTKFEGTWRNNGSQGEETWDILYTFKGSTFICENLDDKFSGTFTFTANTITFTVDWGSWTQNYELVDTTLTLEQDQDMHYNGSFQKQP
jgi:hypothetical protein